MDGWVVGSSAGSGDKGGAGVVQSGGPRRPGGERGFKCGGKEANVGMGVVREQREKKSTKTFSI